MSRPGRFGRRWRESRIEALERELRDLHVDRGAPWNRHPNIPYRVSRFTEWLEIHPAVAQHVGRPVEAFLAEPGWDSFICPADLGRADALWLRCVLAGTPYNGLEYRWRHQESGKYVWLSEVLFPISFGRDGKPWQMGGWISNISPRKKSEIEFLLTCLTSSSDPRNREARRVLARRSQREARDRSELFPLLRPRGGRRRPPGR